MGFENKVVLITGGASGIGKETAIQFAMRGAKVAIFDVNGETVESARREIKKHCSECIAFTGDVRKKDDVEACVDKVFDRFGDLDYLVACAGIRKDGMIAKISEETFGDVVDTNLKGLFLFMQTCVKKWIKEPDAQIKTSKASGKPVPPPRTFPDKRIICISSTAAEGNIGQIAYSASKAGVIGMAKTAAKELIQYNVKTHVVMPTIIDTPMNDDLRLKDDGKWMKYYESRIPLGIGKPKDVANVILFLCSEESSYMNGSVIPLNGGRSDGL